LRDHVADHWQTLLAAEIEGARTVPPLDHDKLSRAARVQALEDAVAAMPAPVVLVAHSAGCLTVAHWAAQANGRVQAALLATPADIENPLPSGYPTPEELQAGGWLPLPRARLPFAAVVAASRNDPLAAFERIERLAQDWGAGLVDLGDVGHLNPAAGFGPWPQGHALVEALTREIAL
jgi:predicted alpha/beta hydrolase family esterase